MTEIDTGTDQLLAGIEEGVLTLTMNRPERRNAVTQEMFGAMGRMLAEAEVDDDVRCVVLTGAGAAFSAGGDVKAMAEAGGGENRTRGPLVAVAHRQRLTQRETSGRLWRMPKPTIAALPGPAAGAGMSLALACDLRYATTNAFLTTAFARVALAGDFGSAWFLTRLVGAGKARELLYFSERIGAEEAVGLGLVNAVFPEESFGEEVGARARRLAQGPAVTYRFMKENLNRAVDSDLFDYMDVEVTNHFGTMRNEDHREAARAFVEKREPRFQGR